MENAILDEIRSELSALKERVAALEKQLDEYERFEAETVAPEEVTAPAEEDFPAEAVQAEEVPAEVEAVTESAPAVEEDLPEETDTAPAEVIEAPAPAEVEEAPAAENAPAFEPEPAEESEAQILEDPILAGPADETPIDLGIDLPDFGSGIKSINDVQSRKIHKRLMDSTSGTPKWKTDLPGSPVRNIISAISLNDRVLMINKLFREDPQLFQQTLSDLNAMSSFADAENYVSEHFSDWKMDSEPVYRFMMAVRRKLNS